MFDETYHLMVNHSTTLRFYLPESAILSIHAPIFSVIFGVGEMDIGRDASLSPGSPPHLPSPPNNPLPYLLLDVRNKDDYDQCHIVTGKSL